MNEEQHHVPVPLSECLRTLRALRFDDLSPAERNELEESAALLELCWPALRELCDRIERCGASEPLTHAVTLASDLLQAIGNKWNPKNKHAEQRVRAALAKVPTYTQQLENVAKGLGMTTDELRAAISSTASKEDE